MPSPVPDTISIQEAWVAAGGNPGFMASKDDLLKTLRMLDQVADEAGPVSREHEMAEARALAAESSVNSFTMGVHEVFDDINGESGFDSDTEQCLIARMERYSDSGDASVGHPPTDMWMVSTNQEGTYLARLKQERDGLANAMVELSWWMREKFGPLGRLSGHLDAKIGPSDEWVAVLVRQMLTTHARDAFERSQAESVPPAEPAQRA